MVGLSGEIFVFRMLPQKYGTDVVTSSSWVSENSKHVFRFNQADETMARDVISLSQSRGKQFRVEVKSSAGADETFS